MITDVVIIGGGTPNEWPDLSSFSNETTAFIGVDRGSLYGLKASFSIEQAVGDFDSLSDEEWTWLQDKVPVIERCAAEKDDTDMQLGVLAAMVKYPEANYHLIGATGGRLDHYLSNLWLPLQERFLPFISQIFITDSQNSVSYFLPGEYTIVKEEDKPYLAYVCLTAVKSLSLYDAKYQLDKVDFNMPTSLSSNEFVGQTSRFSFSEGIMCVIQSKDKKRS